MPKKVVVTGLDGILWQGDGLLRGTYREMANEGLTNFKARPDEKDTRNILRAIGSGVVGKATSEISSIARAVSSRSIEQVDDKMVSLLRQFSPDEYRLVGMSTAPDFVVELALNQLRTEVGIPFDKTHVLDSSFPTSDGRYSAKPNKLHKQEAVRDLVNSLGVLTVDVGFINGISDMGWANAYCETTVPINPGAALTRRLYPTGTEAA